MKTATVTLAYQPQPRQIVAHRLANLGRLDATHSRESLPGEILYGGAAGGGKSYWAIQEGHHRCLFVPRRRVLLLRRTIPQLKMDIIPKLRVLADEVPAICRWAAGDNEMHYTHGRLADESTFLLRSAETEAELWKIQGPGWDTIIVDEAGDWTESELSYLGSRLRVDPALGLKAQKLFTANPAGVGFDYLKRTYVEPILRGTQEPDTAWMPDATDADPHPVQRAYVPAVHSDNRYLDGDYLGNLARITDPLKRAALMTGSWDLPADDLALFQPGAITAMQDGATGFADAVPGHAYLHVWDLARKRDWTVGITLDVSLLPAQIVAYKRFRFVPWPEVGARVSARHASYSAHGCTSVTRWDATGIGDPVGDFFDIPLAAASPFTFTAQSKRDAVMALVLTAERAAMRGPAVGNGIESLWAELALYRWDDAKLVQDSVMALAMAAHDLRDRIASYVAERKRAEKKRVIERDENGLPVGVRQTAVVSAWMGG